MGAAQYSSSARSAATGLRALTVCDLTDEETEAPGRGSDGAGILGPQQHVGVGIFSACCSTSINCSLFFKRFYLFIFRERGTEGEREGEKHQCVVASCMPPTGNPAYNPGMCPDWELNQQPFGSQAGTQSTKPYQPGHINCS